MSWCKTTSRYRKSPKTAPQVQHPLYRYLLLAVCASFLVRDAAAFSVPSPAQTLSFKPVDYLQDEFTKASEFLSSDTIVEMIPKGRSRSSSPDDDRTNTAPLRQEMFSSPLISVLYERILPPLWEAGLRNGGPDQEYQNAAAYLQGDGQTVALDLSCGTGFVGYRMAKSGDFRHVFALDYSRQMLNECVATVSRENVNGKELPLSIIRGDAGNLPFEDGTIDAIHWGAAMHCVPDAEAAMAEVYRVLRPGGKLYATTFLRPFPDVVFRFFDLEELNDIAKGAGFGVDGGDLEVKADKRVYGVILATKAK